MPISRFDEREVEILVLALKFFRSQRGIGQTRRTDPVLTPDEFDVLLAKLGASSLWSLPPATVEPANAFPR